MTEERGSIAFFSTYRPPVPLDIFTCPVPATSSRDELHMTDGISYNYNCQVIPTEALMTIIKRPKLRSEANEDDVKTGRLSGFVFVSERDNGLETLHIGLRFGDDVPVVKVFSLADVYDTFNGIRMEDGGCVAGGYEDGVDHFLVYVSTMERPEERRQPWTAVYKTNLRTGITQRLTPSGVSDLSPSVSPSGEKVAVASFQGKGWNGEIEDLKTDIYVMNVENNPLDRNRVIENGGWPTWGSDNIIFFHRKIVKGGDPRNDFWAVFRANISTGQIAQVTPDGFDSVTPAAINDTKVAVVTKRQASDYTKVRQEAHYRHIEIFDSNVRDQSVKITQNTRPEADHFNPFVVDGGNRIGFHRSKSELLQSGEQINRNFHKLNSPHKDVGLFRVSGVFPTFSKDGSKLAFVDNEFKAVWVADKQGLRIVYKTKTSNNIFAPVWNSNPDKDMLYVCMGPSFMAKEELQICAIPEVSKGARQRRLLTIGSFNNAFPSTNEAGTKLVFRSTRDGGDEKHKNLYIMDAEKGESGEITRLTNGPWTDTHCQWAPKGDWIVFSSTRDKPKNAPLLDNGLDPGYFAVYIVNAGDSTVVRVIRSGDDFAGHVNHPFFSPDMKSIVVSADFAAVSVDPVSLPIIDHSVRPYGDIFNVDIDSDNLNKNKDLKKFVRVTHSRYENSTPTWTGFSTEDPNAQWNMFFKGFYSPACPYMNSGGGESWHMTGHLCIPKRRC
ncbi:uncharacterized protein LOC126667462 [Mercurialis annua]|uniref:uncharacterized protein LOC126667462 n=1 Tax=Mercurialis annua TaxID=3986 RepID=UPI00216075E0|nr:uncharacterized protein LOC126667462 [Mercurialis annua]